ncbi:alpha/beta hydrolase [Caulobacter sp. 17J65-9]|nr:alpha/beta hydrolase [Caulobacter sp. 17J65-9]
MITRRLAMLAGASALTACAPMVQSARQPPPGFDGARLEPRTFVSFDGARLPLRTWAADGEPWAVIVGLHGMNDYAAAFWMAGPWWAKQGITTYAYDQRGFGRAPDRGVWGGRALMAEDLRTLCGLLRKRHPHATIAVAGESMGGAVAITAFADRPPDADRLVLLAPAIWGWSAQPVINRVAVWFAAHTVGDQAIEPPQTFARRIVASDNMPELRRMGRDPLMIWGTRPDAVYGLMNLMEQARSSLRYVRAPVAYLYGEHDEIIPHQPTFQAAHQLKPTDRSAYYANGWHVLLRDYQAETVWRDVVGFLRDPAAPLLSGAPAIPGAPTPPNGQSFR